MTGVCEVAVGVQQAPRGLEYRGWRRVPEVPGVWEESVPGLGGSRRGPKMWGVVGKCPRGLHPQSQRLPLFRGCTEHWSAPFQPPRPTRVEARSGSGSPAVPKSLAPLRDCTRRGRGCTIRDTGARLRISGTHRIVDTRHPQHRARGRSSIAHPLGTVRGATSRSPQSEWPLHGALPRPAQTPLQRAVQPKPRAFHYLRPPRLPGPGPRLPQAPQSRVVA